MLSAGHLRADLLVGLGEWTGQTHALSMVRFPPTARRHSPCVCCDGWPANGKADLTLPEIARGLVLPRLRLW